MFTAEGKDSDTLTTYLNPGPWTQLFISAALLVAFGWAVLYIVDVQKVAVALQKLSPLVLLGYVGLMFSLRILNTWRWLLICRESLGLESYSFWYLLRTNLFVEFINIWFPSFVGGEAVKVWKLTKTEDLSKRIPLAVFLDRLVGVASLGLVTAPLLLAFPTFVPTIQTEVSDSWLIAGAIFVLAVFSALLWKRDYIWGLIRRSWHFFVDNDFLIKPTLISLLTFPVMVVAYFFLLDLLAPRGIFETSLLTLLPRFGRIFPVSAMGVGAVEGGTFVVGKFLSISDQVLVIIVAAHLLSKYVTSLVGLLIELVVEGRGSIRALLEEKPLNPEEYPDTRTEGD
jgi:uncharacterized membrane protein YbhN (UPF0104 family)